MKATLLLLIFAGFSFQFLISAPINQVGSLDEKDALKAPDGELLKRSKQHGISSSIDHLQELGTLDEAVLNRKDNGLPAKRDPWRRWRPNKRWRRKKQKSRCRRKERWMDGCMDGWIRSTMEPTTTTTTPTAAVQGDVSVDATGEPVTGTITHATSTVTMQPTTTTTPPTAAVQGDDSVNATGEPATSTITPATSTMEPTTTTTTPTAAVQGDVSVDAVASGVAGEPSVIKSNPAISTMEPTTTTTPTSAAAHVSNVASTAPAVEGSLPRCTTSIPIKCYNGYHKYG